MKKIITFILFLNFLVAQAPGCTAFSVNTNNGSLLCKNFDWDFGDGLLIFNPAGIVRNYSALHSKSSRWSAKYSSITFNHFGYGFPLGGLNSEGLAVEELSTIPVNNKFESGLALNEFSFIQYLLDNCKDINEVKILLAEIRLETLLFTIHYIVVDRNGNSAIIELEENGFKIFESEKKFQVISNNPIEESQRYLKLFKGYGGKLSIKKSTASNDRFVRLADLLQKADVGKLNTELCFSLLDSVKQHDTQWQIVYNLNLMSVNFKNKFAQNTLLFTFEDLKSVRGLIFIDLSDPNENSKKLTKSKNDLLFDQLIKKYNTDQKGEKMMRKMKSVSTNMLGSDLSKD